MISFEYETAETRDCSFEAKGRSAPWVSSIDFAVMMGSEEEEEEGEEGEGYLWSSMSWSKAPRMTMVES